MVSWMEAFPGVSVEVIREFEVGRLSIVEWHVRFSAEGTASAGQVK